MHKFYPAVGFGGVLLAWWAVSSAGLVNSFLLPSPARVWSTFITLLGNGKLVDHLLVSLSRVGAGYLLAALLALILSMLMTASRRLSAILNPPLEFLRQIPPLAVVPLTMLWLGIGETQKVGIIILACFFPIFLGFRGGFSQVDPKLIEVGRSARFTKGELLWRIVLPGALPAAVVGLRIGLGYGWRALVGAELIASSAGLGYMILDAQDLARTDIVLVGVLTIGVVGLIVDLGLKLIIRRLAPWIRADLELGNA